MSRLNDRTISCLCTTLFCFQILALAQQVVTQKVVNSAKYTVDPELEVNREPQFFLNLGSEVIEIKADGIRPLMSGGAGKLRPGDQASTAFHIAGEGLVRINTKLLEISRDEVKTEVTVIDETKNRVLLSQNLAVKNRQEVIVELADSLSGNSRLALRIIPLIVVNEPVVDYPSVVLEFGSERGILIRNRKELLSLGSAGSARTESLEKGKVQLLTFANRRFGRFLLSYQPFPRAAVLGYFQGRRLIFKWQGDVFEWYSVEKPFLPEGKWSLYLAHEDDVSELTHQGTETGVMTRFLHQWK